jgi:hypothetical protein
LILQQLYSSASFSPGANLWVIPDLAQSYWSNKINWYLNFQISRLINHKKKTTPKKLEKIIQDNKMEFQFHHQVPEQSPVLISPNHQLPCGQVLMLYFESETQWINSIYKEWIHLKTPDTRIFLPKNLDEKTFRELWPDKTDSDYLITIVPATSTSH